MFSCEATEGALVSSSSKSSFFFLSSASQLRNLSSGNGCVCIGGGVNCRGGRGVNLRGGGGIAKPEGRVSLGGTGSDSSSSISDTSLLRSVFWGIRFDSGQE